MYKTIITMISLTEWVYCLLSIDWKKNQTIENV